MHSYLGQSLNCNTISETFTAIGSLFRLEWSNQEDLVRLDEAQQGHEEELVKVVTLMMYLSTVKHMHTGIGKYLQDGSIFSKEVQFRVKCILQVRATDPVPRAH